MAAVSVRRATAGDLEAVAETLGTAFVGDPWIAWIVPADRHRERIAALQASLLGSIGLPHGEVWLAERAGRVLGAGLWLLAGREVPRQAWAQVADVEPELMGDRHASAASAAAATRHLRPSTPHHLLATLGVLPDERHQGIGAALLLPVLDRSDRDGVDAYLETSTEDNLRFYGRLGFEVAGVAHVPDGGPPVWAMLRLPNRSEPLRAAPGRRGARPLRPHDP